MESEFKKSEIVLMIDIGSWDQENFEKKNCGQCPQQIRNYPPISGFNPDLNSQMSMFKL